MTHIAIQEVVEDQNVTWLEPVTGAQYEQPAAQAPPRQESSMKSADDLRAVSPALDRYATTTLNDLWPVVAPGPHAP
jgi:hypothetical protein